MHKRTMITHKAVYKSKKNKAGNFCPSADILVFSKEETCFKSRILDIYIFNFSLLHLQFYKGYRCFSGF